MLADFFYIYIYFMKKVHIGTIYIYIYKNTTLFLPLLVHFYFNTSFQQWM